MAWSTNSLLLENFFINNIMIGIRVEARMGFV